MTCTCTCTCTQPGLTRSKSFLRWLWSTARPSSSSPSQVIPLQCPPEMSPTHLLHSTNFAANELGWTDLTDACDGLHHTQCPVEATRIYNNRWHTFLKTYLAKGPSPIGDITRVWFRQEDQVQQLHPCSILHALLSSPTSPADVHKVHGPHVQPPT